MLARSCLVLLWPMAIWFSIPVLADDASVCGSNTLSADAALAACANLIASGHYSGEGLSAVFDNRGLAYENKGDYNHAIADYSEAIRLNPNFANAFNNRGLAYAGLGDFDRAIADYSEAIRLNPNFAEAFDNRGVAYEKKGDHDHAIADFSEAIRLNPNFANAFNNRGVAYKAKGNLDRAAADFFAAKQLMRSSQDK